MVYAFVYENKEEYISRFPGVPEPDTLNLIRFPPAIDTAFKRGIVML